LHTLLFTTAETLRTDLATHIPVLD
jgi:hypothetical protein